jgi:hypothetical protein
MQVWQEVILYGFLGYIFMHLIIVDALRIYGIVMKARNTQNRKLHTDRVPSTDKLQGVLSPGERDIEDGGRADAVSAAEHTGSLRVGSALQTQKDHLSDSEEHLLEVMVKNVCESVVSCLSKYFDTFQECWRLAVQCLKECMLAYIDLLKYVVEKFLDRDVIIYTCGTACIITGLSILLVYVALHFYQD